MEVTKYPRAIFKKQDDEYVYVQLCVRGVKDRLDYCAKFRVAKKLLVTPYNGRTADLVAVDDDGKLIT